MSKAGLYMIDGKLMMYAQVGSGIYDMIDPTTGIYKTWEGVFNPTIGRVKCSIGNLEKIKNTTNRIFIVPVGGLFLLAGDLVALSNRSWTNDYLFCLTSKGFNFISLNDELNRWSDDCNDRVLSRDCECQGAQIRTIYRNKIVPDDLFVF